MATLNLAVTYLVVVRVEIHLEIMILGSPFGGGGAGNFGDPFGGNTGNF